MAAESHNMRLISRDKLAGFGNVGEGMSMQLTGAGRRILWLAHESAPKNFTGVDVTDPAHPRVICQTDLPHRNVRSNSLEVCGDVMAVAYQTSTHGLQPAGIELFDIANPEAPRAHRLLRLLRSEFARRASVVVHRRQDGVFLRRSAGFHAAQSARRPAVPRHRRQRPDKTAGNLPLVVSRRGRGRYRPAAAAASEIQQRLARA